MSYFSIKNFIEAGEKAIEDKNYWGALSIALALPSMCFRIEFDKPENPDTKKVISVSISYLTEQSFLIL